jgi:hypothetical protein
MQFDIEPNMGQSQQDVKNSCLFQILWATIQ